MSRKDKPLWLDSPSDAPHWKPTRWGGGGDTGGRPSSVMAGTAGNPLLSTGPSLLGSTNKRTSNPEAASKKGYDAALSFYSSEPPPKPKKESKPALDIDVSKFEPYNSPSPSQSRKSRSLTSYGGAVETAVDPIRKSNSITPTVAPTAGEETKEAGGGGLWDDWKSFGTTLLKKPAGSSQPHTPVPAPKEEKRASVPVTITTKVLPQQEKKEPTEIPKREEPPVPKIDESTTPPKHENTSTTAAEPLVVPGDQANLPGLVPPVTNGIHDLAVEEEPDDTPMEFRISLDDDQLLRAAQSKMKTNDVMRQELSDMKKKYQEALDSIDQLTKKLNTESEKVSGLEEEVKQLTRHNTRLVEIVQQQRGGPNATMTTASPIKPTPGNNATPTKGKGGSGKLW